MRAVNLIPPEEYERALLCVMERKYSKAPADKKEKEKRTAALLRLGFSVSEIIKAEKTLY